MLNFPTFPTTFCLFICWVPPSLRNGDCATTIFAANGGTLLCTRQVVLSRYPWIQVIDQAPNSLPFPVAPLAGLDAQVLIEQPFEAQALGKVLKQHCPGMAGQLLGSKADVEFPHLSDYLLSVHLLGASFSAKWGLCNHHFCRERRHFAMHQASRPQPLPVDSGLTTVLQLRVERMRSMVLLLQTDIAYDNRQVRLRYGYHSIFSLPHKCRTVIGKTGG